LESAQQQRGRAVLKNVGIRAADLKRRRRKIRAAARRRRRSKFPNQEIPQEN